MALIVSG